jgi:hypothetical protein
MNKKSALTTAGALTASFVAGAAAVSFNWGLGTPAGVSAATAAPGTATPVKPIIKHRTIVIHKKSPAPPSAGAPRTVVVSAPAPPPATVPVATTSGSHAGGGGGDDGEGGGGGDD